MGNAVIKTSIEANVTMHDESSNYMLHNDPYRMVSLRLLVPVSRWYRMKRNN